MTNAEKIADSFKELAKLDRAIASELLNGASVRNFAMLGLAFQSRAAFYDTLSEAQTETKES